MTTTVTLEQGATVAKFYVVGVELMSAGNGKVRLQAVARGDQNASWAQATPMGGIEMTINNPDALKNFEPGTEYLVRFDPAPKAVAGDGHKFRQDVRGKTEHYGYQSYYADSCGDCGAKLEGHDTPKT